MFRIVHMLPVIVIVVALANVIFEVTTLNVTERVVKVAASAAASPVAL